MHKTLSLFFVFSVFFIWGFDINDDPDVTSDELYEHIKYLSSEELAGRFPGTEGDIKAREYIAAEMQRAGLKPYFNGSYFQEFKLPSGIRLIGKNSIIINGKEFLPENNFVPYGFSSSANISGELVIAGYGISASNLNYDNYTDEFGKPVNVSGKIIVAFRESPPSSDPHNNPFFMYQAARFKGSLAREKNAAALILINPYTDEEDELIKLQNDMSTNDAGIPVIHMKRSHIDDIISANGLSLKQLAEEYASQKIKNSVIVPNSKATLNISLEREYVTTTNIAGYIEGTDPILKNEAVIIGAHYDHVGYGEYGSLYKGTDKRIHYGADDNASGTSGIIELAEKFSENKNNLKRTIVFMAFGAEEAGLIGSSYFTNSTDFNKFTNVAMLNMDMIGRMSENKLMVYGTGTSPDWESILNSFNSHRLNLTFHPEGLGRSDHSSFYMKGLPVLHFFSGSHPDYHSPTDTYDKINYEGQIKILDLVYAVALDADTSINKPLFTKANDENENKPTPTFKVSLGVIPDYASTEEGMKIAGVKPGSPAESAGIKDGDLITSFAGKSIKNIYDYTYVLAELKKDDEVEIIVIRNGQEVKLKAVMK